MSLSRRTISDATGLLLQRFRRLRSIDSAGSDAIAPLSLYQESLWFLHQLSPDSPAYNINTAVRLTGRLSVPALQYSLQKLVQRHEALRTRVDVVDGAPVQVISRTLDPWLDVHDLRNFPESDRESHAQDLIQSESKRQFDLETGPLMRSLLLLLADDEHILLLVLHHIVSDAWSMANIPREMMARYDEYVTGNPAWLRPTVMQYRDFALLQRETLQGETLDRLRSYWRRRLAGLPVLELPTDRLRPPTQTFAGSLQHLDLEPSLLGSLRRLSKQQGVSLFETLLSAFNVFLQRYTAQDDVGIATPVATRDLRALQATIGMLVNTVVIRSDLSGDLTFLQLLNRVHGAVEDAFAHKEEPFAQVVADLQPERVTGHPPLAQVMFSMINVPSPKLKAPDLTASFVEVDREGSQFDLTCSVTDIAGIRGRVSMEYNSALFDADTVSLMLGHYATLLAEIVRNPDRPISRLTMSSEAERNQLLVAWNQTQSSVDLTATLPQLLADQVRATPDAPAVLYEDQQLTYGELDRRSNQLAHYLQSLGIGPGKLVAVAMERSADLVVTLAGILKAGGAYVPLDPAYPPARLEYMLVDSNAQALLTKQGVLRDVASLALHVRTVYVDDGWSIVSGFDAGAPPFAAQPEDLAYVMYTSGSTGTPKGVAVPHRAVTNFLRSMQREPGISSSDRLLAVTSASFDISVLEMFLPLIAGATVVVVDEATAGDGRRLIDAMEQYRPTIMQATPATWRMLLDSRWSGRPDLTILCGGEALARDLADELLTRCASLWNMYGPTETTVWSSVYRVVPGEHEVPIGRPIANTQFYVLAGDGQPVGIGVPGELYIGGAGLASGYLNKPELTDKAFLRRTIDAGPEQRVYRTGDLVRYRGDGVLRILGRLDHQVKVRGFRVELGEIEATLRQHESVSGAVVGVRADRTGMRSLVAYVIPSDEKGISSAQLREFVGKSLPPYMVPQSIVTVPAIPRLPNGKIDRQTLIQSEPGTPPQQAAAEYTPDALSRQLVAIWEQVLATSPVGVADDFFDLGGHSLLAAQMMAEVEEQLGVQPSLSAFLQSPTVAELARIIREETDVRSWSPLVPIQPHGTKPPLYLVHGLGGGVSDYVALARLLGSDQPVYGLQARGSSNDQTPDTSIETMAECYVDALCAAQPEGPFYLAGYSYGGAVAYEMACQLERRGRDTALLALIEQTAPSSGYYEFRLNASCMQGFIANLPHWVRDFRWLEPERQRGRIRKMFRAIGPREPASHVSLPIDLGDYLDDVSQIPEEFWELLAIQLKAIKEYSPPAYAGSVVLLRTPRHPLLCSYERTLGWGSFVTGDVHVRPITGPHHRLVFEPHVRVLATELKSCLDETQNGY